MVCQLEPSAAGNYVHSNWFLHCSLSNLQNDCKLGIKCKLMHHARSWTCLCSSWRWPYYLHKLYITVYWCNEFLVVTFPINDWCWHLGSFHYLIQLNLPWLFNKYYKIFCRLHKRYLSVYWLTTGKNEKKKIDSLHVPAIKFIW